MTLHSAQKTPSQEDFIVVNAFALIMPVYYGDNNANNSNAKEKNNKNDIAAQ